MELTTTERIALTAIHEQFNTSVHSVCQDVERRIGLPEGAIGTTHVLDMGTGVVRERPQMAVVPTAEPDAIAEVAD